MFALLWSAVAMATQPLLNETPVTMPKVAQSAEASGDPEVDAALRRWRKAFETARQAIVPPKDPSNVGENLRWRAQLDQAARGSLRLDQLGVPLNKVGAVIGGIAAELEKIDGENVQYLKSVLPAEGWFTSDRHGAGAELHAWLIAQHSSDAAFQRDVLARIEPLITKGVIPAQAYATMYDRVLMREGKPQRYGTQMQCRDGQMVAQPVENPEELDRRRASMGLGPMSDYVALMQGRRCGSSGASPGTV